jgi:rod shape-determining protein MreC
MGRKLALRVFLSILLLVILYEIWPLPFWYLSKNVILPAGEMTSDAANAAISPFRFLLNISNLDKENKQLVQQNEDLTAEVARLNENVHLCSAVNQEVNLSKIEGQSTVVARIVGRTPNSSNQIIIINAGTNDQVKEGAAVLSSGHLIGQVKKVDSNRSEVKLIFSHDSLVPAILEKTRETGLIQGGLEGLSLTEIPATANVAEQDRVLTSGLGGDLPAGILIGSTRGALKEKDNLFQSIKVLSPVGVSTLEVVSVVK